MTSSLSSAAMRWRRLPHLGVLRFAGPDAASFLQGQVSADTQRLGAGASLLTAYSSPQGRVVAVLHLLPHSSGVLALLPREILLPTLERLRKYVLRSKVQLEDLSEELSLYGGRADDDSPDDDSPAGDAAERFDLPLPAPGAYVERDGMGLARIGVDGSRAWAVGPESQFAQHRSGPAAASGERAELDWRLGDIRAGLPQIYAATREMFVAQMLNLDLIDGISFSKGCFTGQEIIARTQHLGRIKRRLFRLRLPEGSWAIGQAVHLTDGRVGRLTEVVKTGAGFEALAVLSLDASSDSAAGQVQSAADLVDAVEMPLPYSTKAS